MNEASPTWSKVQSMFQRAIELPTAQRSDFLSRQCGDDERLRREVESLLESYEPGEAAFESSPIRSLIEEHGQSIAAMPDAVEGFEILQEVSRGGQGVVYKAYQRSTRRHVAIKFLLQGPFASLDGKERFEREVELVSGLTHPGIVPIFDSGLAQDRYYYVMEFIDGQRLDKYVFDEHLSQRQVLSLFVKVCDAVNHAQQKGVIHRDLKPSNIMVDTAGQPHVLDFGLAKSRRTGVHDALTVSLTGQVMGTLQYMSPEQATGHVHDVDIRSDVYSLGVVLYEVLTGTLPYVLGSTLTDNLTAIRDASPNRHALREAEIGSELATIVLKALHKEPARRYQTAGALSEDLDCFLDGRPIAAKRDSTMYLIGKVLRRNLAATLLAGVTIGIVFVSALVAWSLFLTADRARTREAAASAEARLERDNAESLREQSDQQLYYAEMNLAGQAVGSLGGIRRVQEVTSRWGKSNTAIDRRGWEWYYLSSLCDRESISLDHGPIVWCSAWNPRKDELAFGDELGQVSLWTPGQRPVPLAKMAYPVRALAYNVNGSLIAASWPVDNVAIYDSASGKRIHRFRADDMVTTLAWHPHNPNVLAAGSRDGVIQVRNIRRGRRISDLRSEGSVLSIDWHPGGDRIVSGTQDQKVHVWNVKSDSKVISVGGFLDAVYGVRYSHDGEFLAVCDDGGGVAMLDGSGKRIWRQMSGFPKWSICWGPEDECVASVGRDRSLRIWDRRQGDLLAKYDGHHAEVWSLAWNRETSKIATGSHDGTVKLWDPNAKWSNRVYHLDPESPVLIESLAWSPDGRMIAMASSASDVLLLDSESGRQTAKLSGHTELVRCVNWSADGSTLVSSSHDSTAIVWDVASLTLRHHFRQHGGKLPRFPFHAVNALDLSSDGRRVVSGIHQGVVQVWDASTGQISATLNTQPVVFAAAWQPDTDVVAIASSKTPGVILWEVDSNQQQIVGDFAGELRTVCWSPDGSMLAIGNTLGNVWILDFASKKIIHTLNEHVGTIRSIAWSPIGNRLATGSNDKTVRIWDPATGQQTLVIEGHVREVHTVAWSPDGRQLASAGMHGQVHIWDARAGYDRSNSD